MWKFLLCFFGALAVSAKASTQSISSQIISPLGSYLASTGVSLNFSLGELLVANFGTTSINVSTGLFKQQDERLFSLPIFLKDFWLNSNSLFTEISWTLTAPSEFLSFELEKSSDHANYTKIFSFSRGESRNKILFSYRDAEILPRAFYRLKLIAADNSYSYSNVLLASRIDQAGMVLLYPNPAHTSINLRTIATRPEQATLIVRNALGVPEEIYYRSLSIGSNSFSLPVVQLAQGKHYLEIRTSTSAQFAAFIKF